MDASNTPDWLKGHQSGQKQDKPKVGNPHWRKGMKSPNPAGRPRGISDKRAKLNQKLLTDAQGIVDKMIAQALEGDSHAAGLILSRVMPALRAQAEKVEFDFDSKTTATEQAEAVLQAIADGLVSPDVGKQIIEAIGSLSSIRQVDELEERLSILEGKQ